MKTLKKCNVCEKEYNAVPKRTEENRLRKDGHGLYWECECRSTMFLPNKKIPNESNLRSVVTLLAAITLALTACGTEIPVNSSSSSLTGSSVSAQTYTYNIFVSSTNSNFEIEAFPLDTGTKTSVGTQNLGFTVTASSLTGELIRYSGAGHMNLVIQKDGVTVLSGQSITNPTGTIQFNNL